MRLIASLVFAVTTLGAFGALALPTLDEVTVRTVVSDRDTDGNFGLSYTLSTGASSSGQLFLFSVDIATPPGSASLGSVGLVIENEMAGDRSFDDVAGDVQLEPGSAVPVGCSSPEGWVCLLSVSPHVFWAFASPEHALDPGETVDGYVLASPALPRIRDAFVQPRHVLETEGDEFQEADRERGDVEIATIRVPLRVLGVSPVPEVLDLATYVTDLSNEVIEARSLGWIGSDEALGSLLGGLDDLALALAEDRTGDAKIAANAILSEVASSGCQTLDCPGLPLTSEAFALLHFNVRFVRRQLPNEPPNCVSAAPEQERLWPPNHEMHEVVILGVTDPDQDPLSLVVTGITQDEGVLAEGSGDTCPDAVIGTGTVSVRAERAGGGDGRVYRVEFSATDTAGESCDGVVPVCVPQKNKGTCFEDVGQTHVSTICP